MVSGREQSQLQLFHLQWELLLYRPERACSPAAPEVLVWEGVVWPSRVKDLNDNNLLPVRTKDMVASVKVSMCFPSGLRRLTWWWCCSPLKLQTHFCNKSGEGILGVGRAERGVPALRPQGWWKCWIPVIICFAWYPPCNAECQGKKPRHLQTCPDTSQKQLQSFDLPDSVLSQCCWYFATNNAR